VVGVVRPAGARTRRVRVSGDQDGFLQLHRLRPGGPALAVRRVHRVYGPLDLLALSAAWSGVTARHDGLRATFAELDGVFVRRIAPVAPPLQFIDATQEMVTATAAGWCARLVADVPDPEREQPVRLTVVRLDATTHLLSLVAHRLVADERSADILLGELSQWYAAARTGHLPVLARPVTDDDPSAAGPFDLPGPSVELDLPAAGPRPAGVAGPGGRVVFRWEESVTRQLSALARAEGVEPAAVVVAAFQALLHRYGRATRVGVGVTARRDGPAVGCFATVRLDVADFTDGTSLRTLLAGSRGTHRPPPFGDLVRSVAATRDLGQRALVDAAVDFAGEEPRLRLPGTVVWRQTFGPLPVVADLTLTVRRQHPALAGELTFRSGLFAEHSATQVLEQLRALLVAALADPGAPVDTLPLGASRVAGTSILDERQTAVVPVPESVLACARSAPDAPAIVADGATCTYAELLAHAAGIAAVLRNRGTGPGAAVVVRMAPGAVQAATILGVWETGARVVCLAPGDPGERGRAALAGLAPHALVVNGPCAGDPLCGWFSEEIGAVVVDAASTGTAAVGPVTTAPEDPAYIAYTSGSTGVPKGIPMTHAALAQFTGWMRAHFGIGPGARIAQWAAPGYDASLVELFLALGSGAASYPVPERFRGHPGKVLDWLDRGRITLFQTVPSFARALLKEIVARDEAPAALRHLLLAGEPLPADLADGLRAALPGTRLVNLYGPTETILATHHEITGPVHGRTPIGVPIPGRDVQVLDPDDRPCPPGVAGEIVIASPYVTTGYAGSPGAPRDAFRPPPGAAAGAGWYRTGDLGRVRWDGLFECLGRLDEQIKFQGVRLEVTDIEAALAACESVGQCAVVPVTGDDGLVVRLVAYVVPVAPGAGPPAPDELRGHLRRRFGAAMPPVSFRSLSGLPRNAGGKVDRRRLPSSRG
jgi:(S)-beta-tyrosine adenylation enzyme